MEIADIVQKEIKKDQREHAKKMAYVPKAVEYYVNAVKKVGLVNGVGMKMQNLKVDVITFITKYNKREIRKIWEAKDKMISISGYDGKGISNEILELDREMFVGDYKMLYSRRK